MPHFPLVTAPAARIVAAAAPSGGGPDLALLALALALGAALGAGGALATRRRPLRT
jgi:uncharacterized protein HemX